MKNVKGKSFLITGGTGFLGKNLIKFIEENGGTADGFGSEYDLTQDESVDVYGLTKKSMCVGISAYKSQYGLKGTTATFATLYGPHDSFDIEKAHVVSALVKKFVDAKDNNLPQVEIWGDGTQTRELIYVEDQIKGLISVLDYDGDLINIGTGIAHTIKELAETIRDIVKYDGEIFYNVNKFVGVKHKILDITIAKEKYSWTNEITIDTLKNNLVKTIDWYNQNKYEI
jgi:GDP-L-fucose synthase